MAYKIIRPRHGIKSLWNTYKSRIYKLGEMLVESPESGVGSGPVNIKFGDGVTDYEKLPYAVLAPVDEVSEGVDNPPTSNAVFQCVSKFKAKIASAITDMGVETDATATADTMAANILAIESGVDTSDATATANEIIKGKTAYVNGEKLTGTYDFASKTSATAVAAQISSGYTAWVNGVKITGTRPAIVNSKTGTKTITITSPSHTEHVVNFGVTFDKVPTVRFTRTGGTHQVHVGYESSPKTITKSYFTINAMVNHQAVTSATLSIEWSASES